MRRMDEPRGPLAPETVAVTAGRPHAPGEPLNVPPVMASVYLVTPSLSSHFRV